MKKAFYNPTNKGISIVEYWNKEKFIEYAGQAESIAEALFRVRGLYGIYKISTDRGYLNG